MLLFLVDDGVVLVVAWSVLTFLVGAGLSFYQKRSMRRLNFAGLYAFVVSFGFAVGAFIDVLRYSSQIGGINGGTPYIFAIMFGMPLTYGVSVFVLYVGAFILDKLKDSKGT